MQHLPQRKHKPRTPAIAVKQGEDSNGGVHASSDVNVTKSRKLLILREFRAKIRKCLVVFGFSP